MKNLSKNLFTFIYLLFLTSQIFSQNISVNKLQTIKIDHLENIYIIEKDNFSLISSNSKKEYQNSFFGDIFSADVSNPLRILIFHKEANQIVFINNELSIIGDAISLDEINLIDIAVACASQINGFWIYNILKQRIEFYNSSLQLEHSSLELSQYISSVDDIQEIKMSRELIYLRVKNTGILVFDMFATYIKTLPIKEISSFQILEKSILYSQNNQILIYDFDKLNNSVIFQAESKIEYSRIFNSKLYYLEDNELKQKILENTSQ